MPITLHCVTCGSEDVHRDAFAAWNPDTQEWELAAVYDSATCQTCDTDTTLIERQTMPEATSVAGPERGRTH